MLKHLKISLSATEWAFPLAIFRNNFKLMSAIMWKCPGARERKNDDVRHTAANVNGERQKFGGCIAFFWAPVSPVVSHKYTVVSDAGA